MRHLPWLLLVPSLALAHGGLPISESILVRPGPEGNELFVPTRFWGAFFGREGGPWRWICEEAINKRQDRRWTRGGSGAYHVTDYEGVTSSRDGGCTWIAAPGELRKRSTAQVIADPVAPSRVWATTDSGLDLPWNGLFRSDDDGQTWSVALQADEFLRGPALSADGKVIYVVGAPRRMGDGKPRLHLSRDGGATFTTVAIDFVRGGLRPTQLEPLAVDPDDPGTVYLRAATDPTRYLLRLAGFGARLDELLGVDADLGELAFDRPRRAILAATRAGVYRSVGGSPFRLLPQLSRAQCLRFVGERLYACAWNYSPDFMAVARSDDGGDHFSRVFQYDQTVGPITTCGADTPVAKICPGVWLLYAEQLGISLPTDGGVGDGGGPPPPRGGCTLGAAAGHGAAGEPLVVALLMAIGIAALRRRR